MARIRSIKPEFATDGTMRRLSDSASLFFILLWNHCDDYGYFTLDTWELALKTGRWRSQEVSKMLSALVRAGLVDTSKSLGVGFVRSWSHQKIDKPRSSKWQTVEIKWDSDEPFADTSSTPRRKDSIGKDSIGEERIGISQEPKKEKKQEPKKDIPDSASPSPEPVETDFKILCRKAREAFELSFFDRYQVEPIGNARTNAQIKQFCQLVGKDAPELLKFYVAHPDVYYVKNQHPIGIALAQYAQLYTQFKRGRAITTGDVRAYEKHDALKSQLDRIDRGEI